LSTGGFVREKTDTRADVPFPGRPFSHVSSGSPRSLTFEEIAVLQGVGPIEDPNDLAGGWPGEVDDGFEEAVLVWRGHGPGPQE
jgi:hypothetical protein